MTSLRFFIAGIALTSALVFSPAFADWESKPFTWGPWELQLAMKDAAGLGLRNVSYQGKQVLGKGNLPVIRDKYVRECPAWHPFSWFGLGRSSGRCGPIGDRISPPRLIEIPNCDRKKLCQAAHTIQGVKSLELGVYAKIGQYHLYQAWYLSEDGRLYPSVQSWNLSCNTDHDHHAYWRLDFDIGGSDQDQVFVLDRNSSEDNGWGQDWQKYLTEEYDKKPGNHSRVASGLCAMIPPVRASGLFPGPLMANRGSFRIATSRFGNFTGMKMPAGHSTQKAIWNLMVMKTSWRPMWSFGMSPISPIRRRRGIVPCANEWGHSSRFIRKLP
jgi:hypothetical protein